MMLAEIPDWAAIAGAIGIVAAALAGAYVLFKRTSREQTAADRQAERDDIAANNNYWQAQCEKDRAFDTKWRAEMVAKMDQLATEHYKCEQEHAQARGQIASLIADREQLNMRIAFLEKLAGKT